MTDQALSTRWTALISRNRGSTRAEKGRIIEIKVNHMTIWRPLKRMVARTKPEGMEMATERITDVMEYQRELITQVLINPSPNIWILFQAVI